MFCDRLMKAIISLAVYILFNLFLIGIIDCEEGNQVVMGSDLEM